jgi:hydroxymethylglutaryl-CoA synthase
VLPAQVGNIYTGSLYLALASCSPLSTRDLERAQRIGAVQLRQRLVRRVLQRHVVAGAQERVRALQLQALLDARRKLTIEEYETIMRAREATDEKTMEPVVGDGFRFLGVDAHKRTYAGPTA